MKKLHVYEKIVELAECNIPETTTSRKMQALLYYNDWSLTCFVIAYVALGQKS